MEIQALVDKSVKYAQESMDSDLMSIEWNIKHIEGIMESLDCQIDQLKRTIEFFKKKKAFVLGEFGE